MKTQTQIEASLLNHLQTGSELITDVLDCYAETTAEEVQVGRILKSLYRAGTVRLVAVADRSRFDGADLARLEAALDAGDQTFVRVELAE